MPRTIPESLEIELEEGFSQDIDIFRRADFGAKLLATVKESGGQIIALEAQFGEGKTTFVKMWQGLLRHHEVESIYFDAFITDFAESPFLAIAGELYERLYGTDKKKGNKFIKSVKRVGGLLLNTGTKIVLDTATNALAGSTAGAIDLNKIVKQIAKAQETGIHRFITEWKQKKSAIVDFRETLCSVVDGEESSPLVIIIDELDRCKPSYALDMIEILKHLFTVRNVVCLLVLNRESLNKMILTRYGHESADRYMEKFIHKWFELPARNKDDFESPTSFIRYNFVHVFQNQQDFANTYLVRSCLARISDQMNLSLRDIQRCLGLILAAYRDKVKSLNEPESLYLVFLAVTKVMLPEIYNGVARGQYDIPKKFAEYGYSLITKKGRLTPRMIEILQSAFEDGIPLDAWSYARSVIEGT